jgi:hypothetical protein
MIPEAELDQLHLCMEEAHQAALGGEIGLGYERLQSGLNRVEQFFLDEPWGEALQERWRQALAAYSRRFDRRAGGNVDRGPVSALEAERGERLPFA